MSRKNKWTAGSGRWSSTQGKSAQVREPPRPVEVESETPPRPLSLIERLPTLSDAELAALQANAKRVAENAKDKKMADAAELLPLIADELARRVVSKAEAGVERKKVMATQRATVRARKLATAAAEAAGMEAADEDRDGAPDERPEAPDRPLSFAAANFGIESILPHSGGDIGSFWGEGRLPGNRIPENRGSESRGKVFISYSRADKAFAADLVLGLAACGFAAYIDREDIAAGEVWQKRLAGLIAEADTIVYVISPDSLGIRALFVGAAGEPAAGEAHPAGSMAAGRGCGDASRTEAAQLHFLFRRGPHIRIGAGAAGRGDAHGYRLDPRTHAHRRAGGSDGAAAGQSEALLLRGDDLDAAAEWRCAKPVGAPAVTDEQADFIKASSDARAEAERRASAAKAGLLTAVSVAAVVFAGAAAGVAWMAVGAKAKRGEAAGTTVAGNANTRLGAEIVAAHGAVGERILCRRQGLVSGRRELFRRDSAGRTVGRRQADADHVRHDHRGRPGASALCGRAAACWCWRRRRQTRSCRWRCAVRPRSAAGAFRHAAGGCAAAAAGNLAAR